MNTERTRTPKLHDRPKLKATIKWHAQEARRLRDEARETTGMDRHYLKEEAKEYALAQRTFLLAYGYLRGLTIERMESIHTRPENLPNHEWILDIAESVFMKGPDSDAEWDEDEEYAPGWDEFADHVEADIKEWKKRVNLAHTEREAVRRAAKGAA